MKFLTPLNGFELIPTPKSPEEGEGLFSDEVLEEDFGFPVEKERDLEALPL